MNVNDCFTGQSLIQSLPKKGQLYGDLTCTRLIWRLIQQISSQGLATYGVFKKREVTFLCMKLALFGWKSRVLSPWTCLIHSNTKSSCHDSKSPIPKSADETGLAMLIFALVRGPHNTLLHGWCGAASNGELHLVKKLKPEPWASKPMEFPSLDIDMWKPPALNQKERNGKLGKSSYWGIFRLIFVQVGCCRIDGLNN